MTHQQINNYGLVTSDITSDHYILGGFSSVPKNVLQPDGQWDAYLPLYEPQAEKFETAGCTVWGTQNAIEILYKKLFGVEPNYSERFTYNIVPVRPPGADPHVTCEAIRKNGIVEASILPITDTFDDFCTPYPMSGSLLAKGQFWLKKHVFMHEWVFSGDIPKNERITKIKDALRYSPLGVSVTAWHKEGDVYVDNGKPNNHWCVCYGWTRKGWKIFDSYDHSTKIVSFDHNICFVKRFFLEKQTYQPNWIVDIFQRLLRCIGL